MTTDAFIERLMELPQPGDVVADEHRPLSDYPTMPTGTCYMSSRTLAVIYPELTVVYGKATWVVGSGAMVELDHAWNTRADGTIIDSTLDRSLPHDDLTYWPKETR